MNVKEVFIATKNKGKVEEFTSFFADKGIVVRSLLDIDEKIDVIEDGESFEENASKKAEEIGKMMNKVVISDDSGLEVDALDGAPGIYSARYAGVGKDDRVNNAKLLQELSQVKEEDRTARFVCVLAMYVPNKGTKTWRGTCEGRITKEAKGKNGFGYDPIFFLPGLNKTMAQLSQKEKNKISHRAHAFKKLEENFENWMS